jgi:putative membrane protein
MNMQDILRMIHITCFAAWFGTVLASLFLLKALEPDLTGENMKAADRAALLQSFIKLETKVADVAFIGVIVSGVLLAQFFHGWTPWVFIKSLLIILQVALTMGYIVKSIRPLTYPCSARQYSAWYRLFSISLTMFAIVLGITFFLL